MPGIWDGDTRFIPPCPPCAAGKHEGHVDLYWLHWQGEDKGLASCTCKDPRCQDEEAA